MKFLILCFFNSFYAQAITISTADTKKDTILTYTVFFSIEDFLTSRMKDLQKSLDTIATQNTERKPTSQKEILISIIKKAQSGDKKTQHLLSYIYLDQLLQRESPEYKSLFKDISYNENTKKKIEILFNKSSEEFHFLEAVKNYLKLNTPSTTALKATQYAKNTLLHFDQLKESSSKDFKFLSAFANIDFFYVQQLLPMPIVAIQDIDERKKYILQLAKDNYVPAQYLQSLIDFKDQKFDEALDWMEKVYPRYIRGSSILLAFFYKYFKKDSKKTERFLKKAIYEDKTDILKLELAELYLSNKKMDLLIPIAEEIVQNYQNYPPRPIIDISYNISKILSQGDNKIKKDPLKAYTWFLKIQLYAQQSDIKFFPLEFTKGLEKQLTNKELKSVEQLLKKAIYEDQMEFLKFELAELYLLNKKTDLFIKIGEEIVQNYQNYPPKPVFDILYNISTILLKGDNKVKKDPLKAYAWLYKMRLYAKKLKRDLVPLTLTTKLAKQLTKDELKQAERLGIDLDSLILTTELTEQLTKDELKQAEQMAKLEWDFFQRTKCQGVFH